VGQFWVKKRDKNILPLNLQLSLSLFFLIHSEIYKGIAMQFFLQDPNPKSFYLQIFNPVNNIDYYPKGAA